MSTIFEKISTALEGNDLFQRLASQAENLTSLANTVEGLIKNPPDGFDSLMRMLNEVSLPDLNISGDFASGLSGLKDTLPGDLSSLTGTLTSGFDDLDMTVVGEISGVLSDTLEAIKAIIKLTRIDFKCEDQESGSDNPGHNPGTGGSGGNTTTPKPPGKDSPGTGGTASHQDSTGGGTMKQINTVLDMLPTALDAKTALTFIFNSVNWSKYLPFRIPILNDLRDPLETLLKWDSMDSTAIRAQLKDTLEDLKAFIGSSTDQVMNPLTAELPDLRNRINMDNLKQIAENLAARLSEVSAAINSGDISGTGSAVSAINTLLAQYSTLRTSFQAEVLEKLPALNNRLNALPGALEDSMGYLLSVLQPGDALASIDSLLPGSQEFEIPGGLKEVEEMLGTAIEWFRELANKIDLKTLKEPLETAANGARAAVDGLDNAVVQLTLQVKAIFGQVESLLDEVDIEGIMSQVDEAILDFQETLTQQIASFFEPVSTAVTQVITSISEAVDKFDPEDIKEALQTAIQKLTDIINDETVVSSITGIRDTLESVTRQLEALSFTPLTNAVIDKIEELTQTLQSIDTSQLNAALQMALKAALAALPDDIKPITDPLIEEFGEIVESEAVTLVEVVQRQPQRLLDEVKNFEPAKLMGNVLTEPYQALLSKMKDFKPSRLLEPLQDVLDQLKKRLKENVNPGQLIKPLEPLFEEITRVFDSLKPEKLVEPLEKVIKEVIDNLLEVLPVDEFFEQFDMILEKIKKIANIGDGIKSIIQRIHNIIKTFTDVEGQINSWVDSVLAKVDPGGTSQLQSLLADIKTALDNTQSAALSNRFNQVMDPLFSDLDDLAPQELLTTLVQAYRGISRQALAALNESPEKIALNSLLDRFDPLAPEFSAPYQGLADWKEILVQVKEKYQEMLVDWDKRFHTQDGILAELCQAEADGAQLRQMMRDTIESQLIKPLSPVFTMANLLHRTVNAFLSKFQEFISSLQAKLTDLLLGPDSLKGIRDALNELVQRVRDFNLNFIKESLKSLFDNIRGKLDVVSPARLREKVEEFFDNMLKSIDLGLLLPPGEVERLDSAFDKIIDKLNDLDPDKLVTQVVQGEFDEKILPLLEVFDLNELFETLTDRLETLDDELKSEIVRVNGAFQMMVRAAQ
jgi:hypothetical protein